MPVAFNQMPPSGAGAATTMGNSASARRQRSGTQRRWRGSGARLIPRQTAQETTPAQLRRTRRSGAGVSAPTAAMAAHSGSAQLSQRIHRHKLDRAPGRPSALAHGPHAASRPTPHSGAGATAIRGTSAAVSQAMRMTAMCQYLLPAATPGPRSDDRATVAAPCKPMRRSGAGGAIWMARSGALRVA